MIDEIEIGKDYRPWNDTFTRGATSWSKENAEDTIPWDNCIKAEE